MAGFPSLFRGSLTGFRVLEGLARDDEVERDVLEVYGWERERVAWCLRCARLSCGTCMLVRGVSCWFIDGTTPCAGWDGCDALSSFSAAMASASQSPVNCSGTTDDDGEGTTGEEKAGRAEDGEQGGVSAMLGKLEDEGQSASSS